MLGSLLDQIGKAEQAAEDIKASAAREARDIIKSVEEATAVAARQSARELREGMARLTDEARASAEAEIKKLEAQREAERVALRKTAMSRVPETGRWIFERVVGNGAR